MPSHPRQLAVLRGRVEHVRADVDPVLRGAAGLHRRQRQRVLRELRARQRALWHHAPDDGPVEPLAKRPGGEGRRLGEGPPSPGAHRPLPAATECPRAGRAGGRGRRSSQRVVQQGRLQPGPA
eukprot:6799595-Lingulodinium_polyedra.AAC.1